MVGAVEPGGAMAMTNTSINGSLFFLCEVPRLAQVRIRDNLPVMAELIRQNVSGSIIDDPIQCHFFALRQVPYPSRAARGSLADLTD